MALKEKFGPKLFLRTKPVKILVSLRGGPKYTTLLARESNITYSHTVKLLDLFNDMGLVDFEKKGRIKIVRLTSLGEDISHALENILSKLSKLKERGS
ncbi:MAG: helix-turn-helix domain-containing protein [Candidatus Aenigmatarchaeota archaeon]